MVENEDVNNENEHGRNLHNSKAVERTKYLGFQHAVIEIPARRRSIARQDACEIIINKPPEDTKTNFYRLMTKEVSDYVDHDSVYGEE